MGINTNDHRRFLKGNMKESKAMIGSYFPKLLKISGNANIDLKFLKKTDYGSICFFMDESCEQCDINPIISFVNRFPDLTYIVFLEGSKTWAKEIKSKCNNQILIYQCNIKEIEKDTKVVIVPWAYALNREGQIIGGGIFNHTIQIQLLANPLIRVNYPEQWKKVE